MIYFIRFIKFFQIAMEITTSILVVLFIMTAILVYRERYPSKVVIQDPPTLKLAQGSPIPISGFPKDIPLSNVPKSIEMVAPSSIPLHAEPLLVNYGNAPQLQLAEIPPLRFETPSPILIRNNPCDGLSGKFRGVGSSCAKFIWQDIGCVEGRRGYSDWDQKRTKDELYSDYSNWMSSPASIYREGCYGENWDEYVQNPPEIFYVAGPNGEYMPKGYFDDIINQNGWTKATNNQLVAAHEKGAEWCSVGLLSDGSFKWPMQTTKNGCGTSGINGTPDAASSGVLVYAPKPPKSKAKTSSYSIAPFNNFLKRWSIFDGITQPSCDEAKSEYLQRNPDVAEAKIDPWTHFTTWGKNEIATKPNRIWPGAWC